MWYNVLRIKRERKGISAYRAASDLGVDRRTYRDWERGKHMPRGYNQEMLIKAFGLDREVFKDV